MICLPRFDVPVINGRRAHIVYPVRVFVYVFQNRVRPIASFCMVGFENNLAQLIIMTRRCVASMSKKYVVTSNVKVTFRKVCA